MTRALELRAYTDKHMILYYQPEMFTKYVYDSLMRTNT